MPRRTTLVALCSVAFAASCVDGTSADRATGPVGVRASVQARQPRRYSEEENLWRLSDRFPGFAGAAFDSSGDMVVLFTDTIRGLAARPVFEEVLRLHGRPDRPAARVKLRKSDNDFAQLALWRDMLVDATMGKPGVEWVDLNEERGKVVVGIRAEALGTMTATVRSMARELAIPESAVLTAKASPVRFAYGPDFGESNWWQRPFEGGLEISTAGCTSGFVVRKANDPTGRYFFTNSHCTSAWMAFDGTRYQQEYLIPDPELMQRLVVSHFAGEVEDPTRKWSWTVWPVSGYHWRDSDAALIRIDDSVSVALGRIARTTYRSSGGPGSLLVDQSSPFFTIVDTEHSGAYMGQQLQKVGASTGWTYGTVLQTCVPRYELGHEDTKLMCQHVTSIYSQGGDSGSPVFSWSGGNSIVLYGMMWGNENGGAVYSGYRSIEDDWNVTDQGFFITH